MWSLQPSDNAKKIARLVTAFGVNLATLLSLCSVSWVAAANIPEQLNFQNILENKDIIFGEGSSFLQDSEGFMWLGGGHALIRYDGYEFKQVDINVSNNPND